MLAGGHNLWAKYAELTEKKSTQGNQDNRGRLAKNGYFLLGITTTLRHGPGSPCIFLRTNPQQLEEHPGGPGSDPPPWDERPLYFANWGGPGWPLLSLRREHGSKVRQFASRAAMDERTAIRYQMGPPA